MVVPARDHPKVLAGLPLEQLVPEGRKTTAKSALIGAMTVGDLVQAALGGQENDDQSDLSWK